MKQLLRKKHLVENGIPLHRRRLWGQPGHVPPIIEMWAAPPIIESKIEKIEKRVYKYRKNGGLAVKERKRTIGRVALAPPIFEDQLSNIAVL